MLEQNGELISLFLIGVMLLGAIRSGCQHNMYLLLAELERRMLANSCFLIAWCIMLLVA